MNAPHIWAKCIDTLEKRERERKKTPSPVYSLYVSNLFAAAALKARPKNTNNVSSSIRFQSQLNKSYFVSPSLCPKRS